MVALKALTERDGRPLVEKLPRTPGRRDSEYMHLLSGPIDTAAHAAQAAAAPKTDASGERTSLTDLAQRVTRLENELADLKARLGEE